MKVVLSDTTDSKTRLEFVTKAEAELFQDFSGELGKVTVRYDKDQTIIYSGVGEGNCPDAHCWRTAAAWGIRSAAEMERQTLAVVIPDMENEKRTRSKAVVEGLVLGGYTFSRYKTKKDFSVSVCHVLGSVLDEKELATVMAVSRSVNYARDLVNENAHVMTPARLAQEAEALDGDMMDVTILGDRKIQEQGLGLLHAVGQGSDYPSRLIVMEYKGAGENKPKTALVGKGITFDSGGQNLKPTGSIETMRQDMAGAGAVLGIMKALAATRPEINVVGVIAAAHNAVDGNAYFPGDIYKSYSGKTVEISNTDAEGRLVLADAVSYCIKNFKPDSVIDLATLTGGVLIALGTVCAGLFCENDAYAQRLFLAGEETRERLWRFPLYDEYKKTMKSDRADVRNVPKLPKGHASSIAGAAFIGEFAEDVCWAHIDIAGTAFNDESPKGEIPQFATGFGVRLILKFLGVI